MSCTSGWRNYSVKKLSPTICSRSLHLNGGYAMNSKGRRKHNRNNRLVSLGRGAANVISRAEAETLELKARLEEHRKEALGNMEQLTKIMARLAELETANDKISETD